MVNENYLTPYFNNKKIFLTGHTGFKGAWLLQILHKMGARVCGYSLAPETNADLFNQINGEELCTQHIIDDVRDAVRIRQAILSFEPDFIFHLAAQPLVIDSYERPLYTFEVNAQGTANILDALRGISKKCVVVCVTTDKVYENNEQGIAFVENDKLGGHDPYSASKAAAEIIISSYRNSFFNTQQYDKHQKVIASARAGNVIGGGDFAQNRIVPDIVKALQNKEEIVLRNPQSTRPWQHVLEPLFGYLLLATKMIDEPTKFAQAYNFGPNERDVLSVEELVKIAIATAKTGTYITPQILPTEKVHEANLLMLNISKASKDLCWQPKYNAKTAIEKTINWYLDARPALQKCDEQIEEFLQD